MDITRNIYEGRSNNSFIATAQKIATLMLFPLILAAIFEAIIKNFLLINVANICISVLNTTRHLFIEEKPAPSTLNLPTKQEEVLAVAPAPLPAAFARAPVPVPAPVQIPIPPLPPPPPSRSWKIIAVGAGKLALGVLALVGIKRLIGYWFQAAGLSREVNG